MAELDYILLSEKEDSPKTDKKEICVFESLLELYQEVSVEPEIKDVLQCILVSITTTKEPFQSIWPKSTDISLIGILLILTLSLSGSSYDVVYLIPNRDKWVKKLFEFCKLFNLSGIQESKEIKIVNLKNNKFVKISFSYLEDFALVFVENPNNLKKNQLNLFNSYLKEGITNLFIVKTYDLDDPKVPLPELFTKKTEILLQKADYFISRMGTIGLVTNLQELKVANRRLDGKKYEEIYNENRKKLKCADISSEFFLDLCVRYPWLLRHHKSWSE